MGPIRRVSGNDRGRSLEVRRADDGSVTARDAVAGEAFQSTRLYWFAWYTFHPNTMVASGSGD